MKSIVRLIATFVLAGGISGIVPNLCAQSTNQPPKEKKTALPGSESSTREKTGKGPFHGKLGAMDKIAKTITVGKRSFQITSETKIKKAGKPATFEDGVVGEVVSGYVKTTADGKLVATTVNFGPKVNADTAENPKPAPAKEDKVSK